MATSFAVFLLWLAYTNLNLGLTRYNIKFKSLPEAFEGFKIAQVSDFHNAERGNPANSIIRILKEEHPDIIVITGDLIDSRTPDLEVISELIEKLVEHAPVYFITGNHEASVDPAILEQLMVILETYGVISLSNQSVFLQKGNAQILLIGLDDPQMPVNKVADAIPIAENINHLASEEIFSILLSHRPEFYDIYQASAANLVFSGHAHGGQIRLPFIGGVFAPNQGYFPKFDSGVYQAEDFALVVSRGIGNSVVPVRFNNQPELVIVELSTSQEITP